MPSMLRSARKPLVGGEAQTVDLGSSVVQGPIRKTYALVQHADTMQDAGETSAETADVNTDLVALII